MRNTVLETLPGWRGNRYVVGVVNTPVSPCVDLLRIIRVNNNRIHRNIRQVPGLVCPGVGGTVRSAGYPKNVTRRAWRVRIKAAYSYVAHW